MKFRFLVLLLCVITEPIAAKAQEPRTPIQPADPIAVTSRTASNPAATSGNVDPGAPIIYPDPMPLNTRLAEFARIYRTMHASAPKATKVANDEAPIAPETKEEEKK